MPTQDRKEVQEPGSGAEEAVQDLSTAIEDGSELEESGQIAGEGPIDPSSSSAPKLSFKERVEEFISRLSTRNNFWHRVCSLIWLPYAFKSGIRMKRVDAETFTAELPFRRFNKNWYNAMAGAALLANSEIAGGMYIFAATGGEFTIVCKELRYRFLRPCYGPALYHVVPRGDLKALIASGSEFNITLDLDIIQQAVIPAAIGSRAKDKRSLVSRMAAKERRVGQCEVTFHVSPTVHNKAKRGHTRNVGKRDQAF